MDSRGWTNKENPDPVDITILWKDKLQKLIDFDPPKLVTWGRVEILLLDFVLS